LNGQKPRNHWHFAVGRSWLFIDKLAIHQQKTGFVNWFVNNGLRDEINLIGFIDSQGMSPADFAVKQP